MGDKIFYIFMQYVPIEGGNRHILAPLDCIGGVFNHFESAIKMASKNEGAVYSASFKDHELILIECLANSTYTSSGICVRYKGDNGFPGKWHDDEIFCYRKLKQIE